MKYIIKKVDKLSKKEIEELGIILSDTWTLGRKNDTNKIDFGINYLKFAWSYSSDCYTVYSDKEKIIGILLLKDKKKNKLNKLEYTIPDLSEYNEHEYNIIDEILKNDNTVELLILNNQYRRLGIGKELNKYIPKKFKLWTTVGECSYQFYDNSNFKLLDSFNLLVKDKNKQIRIYEKY